MKYLVRGYTETELVHQDIDRETFEDIKKAGETCRFALEAEEKFTLLFDNFAEFEVELLRLAEYLLLWRERASDFTKSMQERLLLDRRLANVLASCRLYLDHTDHGLSKIFGNPSTELTCAKEYKQQLHASCWGYRFMEALRNHVQHCGLACHGITSRMHMSEGDDSNYPEFTVYPQADVKILAEDRQFKRDVLAEPLEKGEPIDLRRPLREYMSCFVLLHDRLRETIREVFENARTRYEAACNDYSVLEDRKLRLAFLVELSNIGETVNEIPLLTTFLGYYDKLLKRNVINNSIHRFAVSNTHLKTK
jgi:hypothetical protein